MKIHELVHAVSSLRPTALWHMVGDMDDYSNLVWTDEAQTKPTEQELLAEVDRLQAEHNKYTYMRDRKKAYPSIQDQLDTLYHGGYDEWKATIAAIKEQFPKT